MTETVTEWVPQHNFFLDTLNCENFWYIPIKDLIDRLQVIDSQIEGDVYLDHTDEGQIHPLTIREETSQETLDREKSEAEIKLRKIEALKKQLADLGAEL